MSRNSRDGNPDIYRRGFAVLESFGKHAQRQYLCPGYGFLRGGTVGHYTCKQRDFGQPTAVFFAFTFNDVLHGP